MCLGRSKVGFLSGARFQAPENGGSAKRIRRSRIVFLIAGVLFIVFTFLWVALGITQLQDTVNTVDNANHDVDQILSESAAITTSLRSLGRTGTDLRMDMTSVLENFCTANPDLEAQTGYDFVGSTQDALDFLDDLGDFIDKDLVDVEEGIADAQKGTADVNDVVDKIDGTWQSLLIAVPFVVLATLMLLGMTLVWLEISPPFCTSVLSWVILPLFVIATVVAFLLCGGAVINTVANAGKWALIHHVFTSWVYCILLASHLTTHLDRGTRFLLWGRRRDAGYVSCEYSDCLGI